MLHQNFWNWKRNAIFAIGYKIELNHGKEKQHNIWIHVG